MRELTMHSGYLEHYLAHSKCYRSVSYQVHSCKRCTLFFVHGHLDDVISSYISHSITSFTQHVLFIDMNYHEFFLALPILHKYASE